MITCPICKNSYSKIDKQHLKKHNLSKEQYFEIYGHNAPFGYSPELKEKKSGDNHPFSGKKRSEEQCKNISKGVKKMWESYEPTEKQKEHAREMSKKPDGTSVNLGLKRTEEQKTKMKLKAQETALRLYGYCHTMQSPIIQEKRKNTVLEKYNVEHVMQNKQIMEKRDITVLEKYGVENISQHPDIKSKVQKTIIETCQEKYGTNHPMQDPTVFKKVINSTHRKKLYTFPSGKTSFIQGYENFVLDYLLHHNIKENQINLDNIPSFKYSNKVYFPDIYIPHLKLIIEVKSIWTYQSDYKKNIEKRNSVIQKGYNFSFAIWHKNKVLFI
jgi:hypothetical protein